MLRAYIDESGHESKDWMFLAGFLGTEDQWRDFVPRWQSALGRQRKHLHVQRLRWNQERTRDLLARLGVIPEQCKLTPIFGGVRYQDYEDLISGHPEEKALSGYISCLFPLAARVLAHIPTDERVELVFEEQNQYERFASAALSMLAQSDEPSTRTRLGEPKLAKWSFVPKGTSVMTDVADYFAFALHELWTHPCSRKTEWCETILQTGGRRGIGAILNRHQIRSIVVQSFIRKMIQPLVADLRAMRRKGQ